MSFLYWNMNYHVEHHMFAAVPFYNLPRLHALVARDYPKPLTGFVSGMRTLFEIKARQARDPSFIFVPEFPEGAAPIKWK
jgi:fatty acid desaturase